MKCEKEGCKASAMNGSEFCYFHNPDISEKRKESQANGGRRGRGLYQNIGDPSLENLKQILWDTLGELRHSRADVVSRSKAIVSVSTLLITVIKESRSESDESLYDMLMK